MKILDKITLVIYSTIMLILSIIICLLIFGWLDFNVISNLCYRVLELDTSSRVLLVINIIFILLSVKCIFFTGSDEGEKLGQGILLQNDNGRLMISKETIENLVNSVAQGFESAEGVSTKVSLDKENNVIVFVNLTVKANAVIKELSNNLQSKIKETVKSATDLEVKEVNIKVKDIAKVNTEQ